MSKRVVGRVEYVPKTNQFNTDKYKLLSIEREGENMRIVLHDRQSYITSHVQFCLSHDEWKDLIAEVEAVLFPQVEDTSQEILVENEKQGNEDE